VQRLRTENVNKEPPSPQYPPHYVIILKADVHDIKGGKNAKRNIKKTG
jgi:hypothetical protein